MLVTIRTSTCIALLQGQNSITLPLHIVDVVLLCSSFMPFCGKYYVLSDISNVQHYILPTITSSISMLPGPYHCSQWISPASTTCIYTFTTDIRAIDRSISFIEVAAVVRHPS